jgi:hypothetical protein
MFHRFCNACGISVRAVKTCSKALLVYSRGYGKSPCFLRAAFLWLLGQDYSGSILPSVNGAENMECAL